MALNYSYSAANARADATGALLNGGYVRIYTNPRRTWPDDAITATLLSEHRFSNPAFAAAVDGIMIAEAISEALAVATGAPTWFAAVMANGTTAIFDGSAGGTGSGADLIIDDLTNGEIILNRNTIISSATYTEPR